MPDMTHNPFAAAYRGDRLLNDPTLLPELVDPTDPTSLNNLVAAAWEAFLSNPTDDRWTAFSLVLVAADTAHMSTDDIYDFGREWAAKMPFTGVTPLDEVITMFAPHLKTISDRVMRESNNRRSIR